LDPHVEDDMPDTLPRFDLAADTGDGDEFSDAVVTRIVRVTRAQVQGSAMDGLFAARRRVHGERRIRGLAGAVLHVGGWFVLWQEGPPSAVQAALEPLPERLRYETPRLLHRSVGARTLRERLSLSITQWPDRQERFNAYLEAVAAAAPRLAPGEIWRAFGEPCLLGDAAAPRMPARVALLASDGHRSVEIARRLAEQFDCTLVYRRFAGAEPGSMDVGAAYVDLPLAGGVLRVQAVSRRAFGYALVRQSARHAERIVLAVGEHHAKAIDLAAEVADFVAGADFRPALEVVGDATDVGEAVASLVRQRTGAHVAQHARPRADTQLLALLLGVAPA
jgi:hypothetical protein